METRMPTWLCCLKLKQLLMGWSSVPGVLVWGEMSHSAPTAQCCPICGFLMWLCSFSHSLLGLWVFLGHPLKSRWRYHVLQLVQSTETAPGWCCQVLPPVPSRGTAISAHTAPGPIRTAPGVAEMLRGRTLGTEPWNNCAPQTLVFWTPDERGSP